MAEDDLLKYFEGRMADIDHRFESIESSIETILDILRFHDELLIKNELPPI